MHTFYCEKNCVCIYLSLSNPRSCEYSSRECLQNNNKSQTDWVGWLRSNWFFHSITQLPTRIWWTSTIQTTVTDKFRYSSPAGLLYYFATELWQYVQRGRLQERSWHGVNSRTILSSLYQIDNTLHWFLFHRQLYWLNFAAEIISIK